MKYCPSNWVVPVLASLLHFRFSFITILSYFRSSFSPSWVKKEKEEKRKKEKEERKRKKKGRERERRMEGRKGESRRNRWKEDGCQEERESRVGTRKPDFVFLPSTFSIHLLSFACLFDFILSLPLPLSIIYTEHFLFSLQLLQKESFLSKKNRLY